MAVGGCGPTRNLTPLFLKLRAARKSRTNRFSSTPALGAPSTITINRSDDDEEISPSRQSVQDREVLLHRGPAAQIGSRDISSSSQQLHLLPPIWVDLVEEANDDLSKAKEKFSALQKVQQQRLLRIFGDDDSLQQPERDVEAISVQLTDILRRCETKIKKLGLTAEGQLPDSEIKLRKNAQRNIATQLQSISKQMRLQQQHYVTELRKRHQLGNDETTTASESQAPTATTTMEKLRSPEFYQELVSDQVVMSELEELEQISDQRYSEISKVAQSMAELHGIFKEMNALVVDQGTILDRIDYNVEQVLSQATSATKQIRTAEAYQRSGRARKAILFLLVMIGFLTIALIIKWSTQ